MFLIVGIFLILASTSLVLSEEMCERPVDVVIVTDTSHSLQGILPDYQAATKYFLDLFDPSIDLIGLASFDEIGYVDSYLTNNFILLRNIINSYTPLGATNIDDGVQKGYDIFFNSPVANPNEDFMVILTDGVPTQYTDIFGNVIHCSPSGPPTNVCFNRALATAQKAKNDGVKVYVIGLEITDPFLEQFLKDMSSGQGYYFDSASGSDLELIYKEIKEDICDQKDSDLNVWDDSDSQDIYEDDLMNFYADYFDADITIPTKTPIATGICTIAFDLGSGYGSFSNMTYDPVLELFVYEDSFSNAGTYEFLVICDDVNYDIIKAEDAFTILEEEEEEEDCDDDPANPSFVQHCEPNWECSGWSECHNGIQFRDCEDTNFCEEFYVYGEPLERTSCDLPVEEEVLIEDGFNWLFWLLLGLAILLILLLILFSLRG